MTTTSELLSRAATGEVAAFMEFYDLALERVFCLAMARARAAGLAGELARHAAQQETRRRFVTAWIHAAEHASSGLSPLAWLLSLDVVPADEVAACA